MTSIPFLHSTVISVYRHPYHISLLHLTTPISSYLVLVLHISVVNQLVLKYIHKSYKIGCTSEYQFLLHPPKEPEYELVSWYSKSQDAWISFINQISSMYFVEQTPVRHNYYRLHHHHSKKSPKQKIRLKKEDSDESCVKIYFAYLTVSQFLFIDEYKNHLVLEEF